MGTFYFDIMGTMCYTIYEVIKMKKLKAKERRTNEHKVRLNNEEEKRKNKALRKHKKNSVADLFRHWLNSEVD